jgi:SAM-dependent methyltransferase
MTSGRWRTHPAVRGFDRAAEAYERGRPGYPDRAIRHLGRVLRVGPRRTVVELGSGTGKFTRAVRPWGAARVAIEPIAGMRVVFARVVPDVPVLPGTAESIPLPDGFADAVVAAQSFHWFRPRPALRETARVLRPGGGLGLVWNTRDESVEWSRRLSEIFDRYRRGVPKARAGPWQSAFGRPGSPFGPLHERRFRYVQRLTPSEAIKRVLSVSVIAVLPAAEQRRVTAEVRALLSRRPETRGRHRIDLPYTTEVYWAFRRSSG